MSTATASVIEGLFANAPAEERMYFEFHTAPRNWFKRFLYRLGFKRFAEVRRYTGKPEFYIPTPGEITVTMSDVQPYEPIQPHEAKEGNE